mgnify:CR=1 FL=1
MPDRKPPAEPNAANKKKDRYNPVNMAGRPAGTEEDCEASSDTARKDNDKGQSNKGKTRQ